MRVAPRHAGPASASSPRRWLSNNWPLLTLGVIVLLAFAIRVIDITDNPPGFFTDEAAAGLDAKAILTTGKDMHGHTLPFFFESLGDYKLPVFIYTLVPFVGVLGMTEFSVRLTVAVLGTLTVLTTYFLARELLRRDSEPGWRYEATALVSAGLLAVLPWHVHYSRTGFGEMVSFPLLFTLGWWLFLRANRTAASLIPAALAFGLCFYTYRSAWVVLPPFLLLLVALYHRELLVRRREALWAGLVFAITLLPLALHLLGDSNDRASQSWIFNLESEKSTLELFVDQYRSYFTAAFLFEDGDNGPILRHYLPGQGVLYWFMLPLIVAGAVQLIQRDRRGFALLALLFLYPLGGAVSDTSPISSRAILGSVVFVLLSGFGVRAIIDLVEAVRPRLALIGALAACTIVVIAAAVSATGYLNRYFDEYPLVSEGFWGWQGGPKAILQRYETMQDEYDDLFLEGYFNAPHVFIPFYTGDDCPKCHIGDSTRYDPARRQLFAIRVESADLQKVDFRLIDSFVFRNGEAGFVFIEILGKL